MYKNKFELKQTQEQLLKTYRILNDFKLKDPQDFADISQNLEKLFEKVTDYKSIKPSPLPLLTCPSKAP